MCSTSDEPPDEDLQALSGVELLDRTRELVAAMNVIAAEMTRTVRAADNKRAFAADGMATAQSWLRGHCRLSRTLASQVVRNGRALEQLPMVAEAHAAGELTADQVAVIGKITAPRNLRLIAEQDGDLAGTPPDLPPSPPAHNHAALDERVENSPAQLDADGPEP